MKNIHILPTDKPSRLFTILQFNYVFDNQNEYSEEYKNLHGYKNKHIYITSDEKIKEGDWFLSTLNNKLDKCDDLIYEKNVNLSSWCKKIILTTDQDLIKDGVQKIDDEFLEWFVKNPSCEWVEVDRIELNTDYRSDWKQKFRYKIIIPKDEPNQETLEEAVNKFKKTDVYINEIKKETFEEVAENFYLEQSKAFENDLGDYSIDISRYLVSGFIAGAESQSKRMYSEEDLLNAFEAGMMFIGEDKESFREWFEKFKKK